MANYLATDTDLTAVANAIRTKGGTSAQMAFPDGFVSAVNAIPTGGTPTIGLIDEIDVENGVKLITYDLSALALSYGIVWAEFDNVTFTEDYLYGSVMSYNTVPNDDNGYLEKAVNFTGVMAMPFHEAESINGVLLRGVQGLVALETTTSRANRIISKSDLNYVFSRVVIKLFQGSSYFISGKIRLYGRIA